MPQRQALPCIAASMSLSVGFGVFVEQRGGGHDLAGLAVAALHDVDVEPGFLDRLADRRLRRSPSIVVTRLAPTDETGVTQARGDLAIEMHGAGAARGDAAAELRALQVELVAQDPEQRHVAVATSTVSVLPFTLSVYAIVRAPRACVELQSLLRPLL